MHLKEALKWKEALLSWADAREEQSPFTPSWQASVQKLPRVDPRLVSAGQGMLQDLRVLQDFSRDAQEISRDLIGRSALRFRAHEKYGGSRMPVSEAPSDTPSTPPERFGEPKSEMNEKAL
ncbi:hypothetical protein SRHO_G00017680 [Serrasalmus rhombeus]